MRSIYSRQQIDRRIKGESYRHVQWQNSVDWKFSIASVVPRGWLSQKWAAVRSTKVRNLIIASRTSSCNVINSKTYSTIGVQRNKNCFNSQFGEITATSGTSSNDKVQTSIFTSELCTSDSELNWITNKLHITSNQSLESKNNSSFIASIPFSNQLNNTRASVLDEEPKEVVQSLLAITQNVARYYCQADIKFLSAELISADKQHEIQVEELRPWYEIRINQRKDPYCDGPKILPNPNVTSSQSNRIIALIGHFLFNVSKLDTKIIDGTPPDFGRKWVRKRGAPPWMHQMWASVQIIGRVDSSWKNID